LHTGHAELQRMAGMKTSGRRTDGSVFVHRTIVGPNNF
jgi:hypothetical protein